MWTIVGPFDGETGEVNFAKSKLLKPGSTYGLGRKGQPLLINSKKISHHHCELIIGESKVDDVSDPHSKPNVQLVNKKDKMFKVERNGVPFPANSAAVVELQDGDILQLVSAVSASVRWLPVCVYLSLTRGKASTSLESCAVLGIKVVHTPNPNVTHHITSTLSATASIAASLISACQIVKPEWLSEVLRLGSLPDDDPSSLESHFKMPLASKYRPTFSPELLEKDKTADVWNPNEERLHIFKDYRFMCISEKSREIDNELRGLLERGDGAIETFNIQDGGAKWRKALSRGRAKENVKMVAIASQDAMVAAVGPESWRELLEIAREFEVRVLEPQDIVQTVLDVNVSIFTQGSTDIESSLPHVIPNSIPDEPSAPPPELESAVPSRKKLIRRAVSHQGSQEPASIPDLNPEETLPPRRKLTRRTGSQQPEDTPVSLMLPPEGALPPRRTLTRRANAGLPIISGLNDNSILINSLTTSAPATPAESTAESSIPLQRSKKLKRRLDTTDTIESQLATIGRIEVPEEPAYKKHKALFDASDPEKAGITFDGTNFSGFQSSAASQTQNQSETLGSRSSRSGALHPVREEEEETQQSVPEGSRGQKRKTFSEDVEMADVEEVLAPTPETEAPPAKKRAVDNDNAVHRLPTTTIQAEDRTRPKPPSTVQPTKSKSGASPGKPDTDDAFLKAIASTKRGKKNEDEFDREFNKLKISKPELNKENPEDEWKVLEQFGDDNRVRGNFMVVVPMEVHGKHGGRTRQTETNAEWQGKPNFKKFNKVTSRVRSKLVDLVISDESTMAPATAFSQISADYQQREEPIDIDSPEPPKRTKSQKILINDSDSNNDHPPPVVQKTKNKPPSRAGSVVPKKRAASRRPSTPPLFLEDSEDEGMQQDLAADDDDVQTLQSSAPSRKGTQTRRGTAKKAALKVDDDSDSDAVFKPVKTRKRK
ncbi:proline-rich protein [Desarmillaria tabescens]|uniref:Proline-rich protein n=1 Tax=Armillaria tabescens TaxID=1929756 RepID=A0AA39MVE6_ARMTA|nr:proline-rich protein [Desarmillaria tabescens]KAK0447454.1 proline-rich protein [Desarmillaria tabescens]